MGTWGAGLFDDELAQDAKGAFDAALAAGLGVPEATKQALWAVTEAVRDDERSPTVYLALAALQLRHGRLEEWLKVIALSHILQETGRERWEEAGPDAVEERTQALAQLMTSLESSEPAPRWAKV